MFSSFDDLNSSGQTPGTPEIASNSCASNFSPSRKIRRRANADECSSSNSEDSTSKLPSLDAYDMLQEAQKRRYCSKAGALAVTLIPVCAFSGSRAGETGYWQVAGYVCEFLAVRDLRFKFEQDQLMRPDSVFDPCPENKRVWCCVSFLPYYLLSETLALNSMLTSQSYGTGRWCLPGEAEY